MLYCRPFGCYHNRRQLAHPESCASCANAKNHYTHNFFVGELISQFPTHQLQNLNSRGIHLCNVCVSLVSACLASVISQKDNYYTRMLGELTRTPVTHQ